MTWANNDRKVRFQPLYDSMCNYAIRGIKQGRSEKENILTLLKDIPIDSSRRGVSVASLAYGIRADLTLLSPCHCNQFGESPLRTPQYHESYGLKRRYMSLWTSFDIQHSQLHREIVRAYISSQTSSQPRKTWGFFLFLLRSGPHRIQVR